MEHAESRPYDRCSASVELPGKADPRLEVLFRNREVTVLQNRCRWIGQVQQIGHLSIHVPGVGYGFPAQTQIEGEALGHFEIVLCVDPEHGFPETPIGVRARRRRVKANGGADQKARNVKERVVAPAVGRSDLVVLNALDTHAPFQGMRSPDIGEIITPLVIVKPILPGCAVIHS